MSSVKDIIRPASGELLEKMLVGGHITVNTQPAVRGAGLADRAWIRFDGDPSIFDQGRSGEMSSSGSEPVSEPSGGMDAPDTGKAP